MASARALFARPHGKHALTIRFLSRSADGQGRRCGTFSKMNAGTLSVLQLREKHFTAPEARQTHRSCPVHFHPCYAHAPWAVAVLIVSWLGGSAVLTRSDPLSDGGPMRRKVSDPELSVEVSAKQDLTDQRADGGSVREQAAPCRANIAGPRATPRLSPIFRHTDC
jgi:hypothetical protein